MRYFIELSYNGEKYHGWQYQPNAISLQETIETALSLLLGDEITIVGCGRTDAGVHASQYFLHFDVIEKIDQEKLKYKLNAFLSNDIAIYNIFLVQNDLHARFDAISRSYEYRIYLGKSPFLLNTVWQIQNRNFDIEKMNKAARILYEYENFKCFSKSNSDVKTYNCLVSNAEWVKEENYLTFYISANRFLRNMVRAIVGTLMDVGQHKISIEGFRKIIEGGDRSEAGASVKAKGLFLTQVVYPKKVLRNYNDEK